MADNESGACFDQDLVLRHQSSRGGATNLPAATDYENSHGIFCFDIIRLDSWASRQRRATVPNHCCEKVTIVKGPMRARVG